MSGQIPQLNERIEKIRAFVTSYQEVLRGLVNSLPDDGILIPLPIAAAIGRCEIWPCRDAVTVLTYDDSPDASVTVRDYVDRKFSDFLKDGDPFAYFNESGESVPIRISFQPAHVGVPLGMSVPADDFSFSSFSFDALITWGPKGKPDSLDLSRTLCRPRFKRLSVFGWNAWIGNSKEQARRDFREGFMARNMLVSGQETLSPGRREMIFRSAEELIREFETLLDSSAADSQVREVLVRRPELISADYLRCYRGTVSNDDTEPDLTLLALGEEELEWMVVKLGNVSNSYFSDPDELSESFINAKTTLSTCAERLTRDSEKLAPVTIDTKKLSYQFVMGRNSGLSYQQRKHLRLQSSAASQKFCTYDDLVNRFRYHVNDVTGIRERYPTVDERLAKLNIRTDEDFNRLMEQIDAEMRDEGIPLTARSMEGGLRFSSTFELNLMGTDPLSIKVHRWFQRRYGDRLNIDMGIGSMGVILRGDTYRMHFPTSFGLNRIVSLRKLAEEKPSVIVGTRDNPPTLNVLDFVEGLTQDYANSLTDEELEGLFNQFVFGFTAFMRISEIANSDALKSQAYADLNASTNHLFTTPPNYGLSKWASLQAAEKFIKAFITSRGGSPPRHHRLRDLARLAESLGLAGMLDQWLDDVQCSAEVRYGGIPVTPQEAIDAQYGALQICEHIANA